MTKHDLETDYIFEIAKTYTALNINSNARESIELPIYVALCNFNVFTNHYY